ncbi:MAG: AAA family ATPase [Candidatus Omnitrophota bacterium]
MNEEKSLKHIPYGVSRFHDFQKFNYYYIDKSKYIRNIEEKGQYLFLIRPRRFGKSLFLATLETYYDIALKDKFDSLFSDTEIYRNPTSEKSKYMILSLDFSIVDSDIDMVKTAFLTRIQNAAEDFVTKYQKFLDIDIKEAKLKFNSKKSASEVMDTLLNYCLNKEYKIYTIIDEYDNFANTILSEHGEEKFQTITHGGGFLRSFFNVLKAGTARADGPISRLFMAGVSPITLDDVTSGFNIAANISLDSDINEIMGFTHSEVETMIDYYRQAGKIRHSTPELMEIMSQWYNHYRFAINATQEVFNTIHVLYFLREYMKDSQIPVNLIDNNASIDYGKLRHLIIIDSKGIPKINGNFSKLQRLIEINTASTYIKASFPTRRLTESENFYSLLFYFGLLTIKGVTPTRQAILTIPNEFVKRLYYDIIKETYEKTGMVYHSEI